MKVGLLIRQIFGSRMSPKKPRKAPEKLAPLVVDSGANEKFNLFTKVDLTNVLTDI